MAFRRFLPLLLLLVLSITLMTYQSGKASLTSPEFFSNPLNYLNGVFHSLVVFVRRPFDKIALRDEDNKRLREEINKLLLERQGYRDIFLENQRLKGLLLLKSMEKRHIAAARVISKSLDPWSNAVVIDKGSSDGILKNMAVITPKGLVGKVSFVSRNYANILLITDIAFSAAIKIQETRKDDILSGTGSGNCILKYVLHEETVNKGDVIVTSGFDEIFPPGIPVGNVSAVLRNDSGIFQRIEIKPFQDLLTLDEVIIIKR